MLARLLYMQKLGVITPPTVYGAEKQRENGIQRVRKWNKRWGGGEKRVSSHSTLLVYVFTIPTSYTNIIVLVQFSSLQLVIKICLHLICE